MKNLTNILAGTFFKCAICGKPVPADQWYDLIQEHPVHSACFQTSKRSGHSLPLIPQLPITLK